MASNIPVTIPELLSWAATHSELWEQHHGTIGITQGQADEFEARALAARAALLKAAAAREASKAATYGLNVAVEELKAMGGSIVNVIKAFAESTGDVSVYPRAGVSASERPGTLPPPVPPREFETRVNTDGSLTLSWKVRQPAGVIGVQYLVYRTLGAERTEPSFVGIAGREKSFTDQTIPVGTASVSYFVVPRRGSQTGESSNLVMVQFGSGTRAEVRSQTARLAA